MSVLPATTIYQVFYSFTEREKHPHKKSLPQEGRNILSCFIHASRYNSQPSLTLKKTVNAIISRDALSRGTSPNKHAAQLIYTSVRGKV